MLVVYVSWPDFVWRLLQNSDQEQEYDDQYNNGRHLLIFSGASGYFAQRSPRSIEATLVSVDNAVDIVEHRNMAV